MLRETCPDELEEIDVPPRPSPPSAWLIFAPPLAICVGVVLVAALHSAVGSPLGVEWAAEVWDMARMAILPTIACTSFGVYVHRNNERAWRERVRMLPEQRTEPEGWTRSLPEQEPRRRQVRSGSYRALPPADWSVMVEDEEEDR